MGKILLAEDDPFLINIYANHLKKEGFKVDIANDGQMALDKVKSTHPDLLLLDILMPKMNGWEVLEALRKDPAIKDLKVIVISNLNQQEHAEEIARLRVTKYFLKVETTPEEISDAIKEALK